LRHLVFAAGSKPIAVALGSALHSLMAVDEKGNPLTQLWLWSDNRSQAAAAELKGTALGKEIYRRTGTPVHPMSPLCKIAWMKRHEPAIFSKTFKFLGIKEYLIFKLFGEFLTDYSVASATGLFDAEQLDWFSPALDFAGISPSQLPQPVSPTHILQGLKKEFAQKTGIPADTPFLLGGGDGCLANLGAGATGDTAVLTIGTSAALRLTTNKKLDDPQERIFNYLLVENQFVAGGASNNGAVVYEWFTRQFFGASPSAKSMERHRKALENVPPGSDGLLFLPYLFGERAPLWNANAKGFFQNITTRHTLAHFHRAVLEGILLNIRLVGQVLEELSAPIGRIHANGGFTRLDIWVEMAADIFGKEVHVFENEDSPALGAVLLALKTLDIGNSEPHFLPRRIFLPDERNVEIYWRKLDEFKSATATLKS
ncbi:MAG: gluconokinase, partial [Bacteroidota bacterium]